MKIIFMKLSNIELYFQNTCVCLLFNFCHMPEIYNDAIVALIRKHKDEEDGL